MEVISVSPKVRGSFTTSASQSLFHNSPLRSPSLLELKRAGFQGQQPRRPSRGVPQIAAVTTTRFYYVRDGRILRTRIQSADLNSQGFPISAVPVKVAHELLNAGHHYLDVRTSEEFAAGHIEGAVNVPYMFKVGSGLTRNLNFLQDVRSRFGKDDEIVVGCQLGKRSQMAATELVAAGYTGVTDMAGGYAAWVEIGMPTKPYA